MTDIPGTGKVSPKKEKKEAEKTRTHVEKLATVNIKAIKQAKNLPKLEPEDKLWYNQLRSWVLFGSAIGIIFVPFAILLNWRFVFLTILGPLCGWVSWYVRRLTKKFGKETDTYTRRY